MCAAVVNTAIGVTGAASAAGFTLNTYLAGTWQLRKRLEYRRGGNFGTWEGLATFRPVDVGGPSTSATEGAVAAPPATAATGDGSGTAVAAEDASSHGLAAAPAAGTVLTSRRADGTVPYPNLAELEAGGCDNSLIYTEEGLLYFDGSSNGFNSAGKPLLFDCGVSPPKVYFIEEPQSSIRFFHDLPFKLTGAMAAAMVEGGAAGSVVGGDTTEKPMSQEVLSERAGKGIPEVPSVPSDPLPLDLGEGVKRPLCSFRHYCGPDIYDGMMRIADPDHFQIHWHIEGPNKDGDIRQDYARVTGGAAP